MSAIYSKAWVIDGFVGVGKSTALEGIHSTLNQRFPGLKTHFYWENTEVWQNYHGQNLLREMYENRDSEWKVRFQNKAIIDAMRQDSTIRQELGEVLSVQERDLLSIQKVFLPSLETQLHEVDYHLLSELVEHGLKEDRSFHVKGRIFLHCEESECYERMKKRGRPCEAEITREKFAEMYASMMKLQDECDFIIDCTYLVREEVVDIVAAYILEVSIKHEVLISRTSVQS